MVDPVLVNTDKDASTATNFPIAAEKIGSDYYQYVKFGFGGAGSFTLVTAGAPLPVTDSAATAHLSTLAGCVTTGKVQVDVGTLPAISGSVSITGSVAVTGPLTDTQLRATAVPVSGPLTDTQLRATAVPVSGTVAISGSVTVTGGLTDTQLRASAVAVSAASLPLPSGASTSALQTTGNGYLQTLAGAVSGTELQVDVLTMPAITIDTITTVGSITNVVTVTGPLTDTQLRATAVAIQDGGNVITVDGTVAINGSVAHDAAIAGNPVNIAARASTATPSAVSADGDVCRLWSTRLGVLQVSLRDLAGDSAMDETNNALRTTLVTELPAGTQTIGAVNIAAAQTLANVTTLGTITNVVNVADNGGSLTVDGTVGISGTVTVAGTAAADAPVSGNPFSMAARASAVAPTEVNANGDVVHLWADRRGTLQTGLVDSNGVSIIDSGTQSVRTTFVNTSIESVISDLTTTATVRALAGGNSLNVSITDGSGNQITSFGGGTQYTEGASAAADPIGGASLMPSAASVTSLVTAGQNVAQRATVYGAGFVQIVSSSGAFIDSFGGGTEYTEDAAAAADPVGGVQILVRKDTPAAITGTDGDNVAQRGSNFGAAYAHILDSAGAIVSSFGGTATEGPVRLTGTLTRSSTATAYTAGDAVSAGAVLSIANATAVSGGFLEIRDVRIVSSIKGSPLPYFNLWILSATYTAQTDYDPVTLSDAENLTVEAIIPVNQQNSATNTASVEAHGLSNLVKLSGTTLYYILEITNAYTPGNAETLDVIINARRVA
jgi:hypothetical protein